MIFKLCTWVQAQTTKESPAIQSVLTSQISYTSWIFRDAQRDYVSCQNLRAWVGRWDLYPFSPTVMSILFPLYHGCCFLVIARNKTNRERRWNCLIIKHFKGSLPALNLASVFFYRTHKKGKLNWILVLVSWKNCFTKSLAGEREIEWNSGNF